MAIKPKPPEANGYADNWYDVPQDDTVDDDTVVDYLAQMNNREDPEEGLVPHRVRRFASFSRQMVALSWFRPEEWREDFSESMAEGYADDPVASAPPIIVDSVEKSIIDGFHRLNAAKLRGDTHILAYVGVEPRPEWVPYDENNPTPTPRHGPR